MKRATILPLFLAVLSLLGGCARRPAPNIVVVVVDTLRADRLGAYGNRRGLTPFLDSLAARGYVFRRAYAQSPWTNPSVASLVTSRYQSQHGIITFDSVLADSEVTLAEQLRALGYKTGFFSANGLIARRTKFDQGYDEFKSLLAKGPGAPAEQRLPARATRINQEALAWVDRVQAAAPSAPIFLHTHYMEPHHPYAPIPEALAHVTDGNEPPNVERATSTAFFGHLLPLEPDVLRNLQDVYDAEVLSIDTGIRALFEQLEKRHVLDNAVVVITADHGEEFKEHGLIGHEKTLFEEVVRVPLIVLVPGQRARVDVEQIVGLVDVAPSLIDLAGGSVPASFEGRSWKGTLVRDPNRPGWLSWGSGPSEAGKTYTELIKGAERDAKRFTPHQHAVVSGNRKLIVGLHGEREYYDLAGDAAEQNPNGLNDADRAELNALFDEMRALAKARAAPRQTQALDDDTRERMRALGYDH
jgi:arylsulfatase A-like enzyme